MHVQASNRAPTQDASTPNFPADFMSWHSMQIILARPRVLAELKRPPPRHTKNLDKFAFRLETIMEEAQVQVAEQAELTFSQYERSGIKNLVIIAAVGEWYTFRIVRPSDFVEVEMVLEGLEANTVPQNPRVIMPIDNDLDEEMDEIEQNDNAPMKRYTDIGKGRMALVYDDVEKAMPLMDWSSYILFGTPASNQTLYLIHRELSLPL